MLQDLCKKGYLISENSGRWTTYHLNKNFNVDTSNVDTSNVDTSNVSKKLADKILAFCQNEFRTVREIAIATDRSEKHLKNRVVNQLVKERKLARKYPDLPNHPDQAYKTTE